MITQDTTNAIAGGTLTTITAAVEDQYGNVVTDDTSAVDIAIDTGSGSLLGTTTKNAVAGIVTFDDLSIHTADDYTLTVSESGLTSDTTASFTVSPDVPSQLVITQDTSGTAAGTTLSSIIVHVEDQYGNLVTNDSSAVEIAIASGDGSLLGTTTQYADGGIVTFDDLSIQTADSYTLTVSEDGLTGDTTGSFTIDPAAASKLVITQDTSSATAGQTLSAIQVTVEDQYGNVITSDTSAISIAITTGSGTLLGTSTQNAVAGVVTFNDLSIHKADDYVLTVSEEGLVSDATAQFTINPDVASQVAFIGQPGDMLAGDLDTLRVAVEDQYGNIVSGDTSQVTLTLSSGSLLGTLSVAADDGVAMFTDLAIHHPNSYTISATDGLLDAATSNSFTVDPGMPDHLVITQDTSSATAGDTLSSIQVQLQDMYNNLVTYDWSAAYTDMASVSITLASGSGSLLGTTTKNLAGGIVTFNDLSLQQAGDFTLTVSTGRVASDTTASFTISPAAASKLVITQDTTNAVAGGTLDAIQVQVQDQYGNLVSDDTSGVDIAIDTGSGSLLGTTTRSAVAGIVTFDNLSIHKADDYTLTVSESGLTSDTTTSFTVSPDSASQVVITQDTASAVAGHTLSSIQVEIQDQYGNLVDSNALVTMSVDSGSGDLLGTAGVHAVHGLATFSDLSIQTADSYTLDASVDNLAIDTTSSFTISPDAPAKLVISQDTSSATAGNTLDAIEVQVQDQYGNLVDTDTSAVSIAITTGSGTLLGTSTQNAVAGVVTFNDLSIHKADDYVLTVSEDGLASDATAQFAINPDVASQVAFVSQPADASAGGLNTVTVAVEDQYGNVVTGDTSQVDLTISNGTVLGTLSVHAVNGVASFSDLAIHTPGSYTISAEDNLLDAATSNSFAITPAAPSQLVISQDTSGTTAGSTLSSIQVQVLDQYGNLVDTDTSAVSIAITTGSGTLLGTTTQNAVAGVATFNNLSIQTADDYVLTVSEDGLSSDATAQFTISPAAASKLVITQGTTNAIAGDTLSTITVAVEDQYGNVVTDDTSAVDIAIATGSGSLLGTTTKNAVAGIVTFSDLSIHVADGYTLTVSENGLTSATTAPFTVTHATASQLVITQDPTNAVAGNTIASTIVHVLDQYGNLVTNNTSQVTIAIASGTGTLLGTTQVNAVGGIATFRTLSIQRAGDFTLGVSDSSLDTDTTASFTISPAAANKLVFTTQPTSAVAGDLLASIGVSVEDQYGNVVTSNSSNVSLTVNNGGIQISLIATASSGVATFNGLSLSRAGTFAFRATDGNLTAANSSNITISPAAATQLAITQQPSTSAAGTLNAIVVSVEDQYGNVVTDDTSTITMTRASGSGSLGGTTIVTASSGVATFSAATITTAGSYTVAFSDGSLDGATSNSFTVTPAAASQLVITQQTSSTVAGQTLSALQVTVEDQYGNVVTGDTSAVTVTIASGTGTLLGTKTVNAVAGVATFSTLSIRQADTFTLSLSDTGLTGATSNSFTISHDVAAKLAFTQQPAGAVAGATMASVQVTVEDQYGNVITGDTSAVTLTLSSGALSGTIARNAVAGVATFNDLSINTAGSKTLSASDGALTGATSNSFTITPSTATKLVFTQEPSSGSVGGLGTVTVAIEDQYDNVVTSSSAAVFVDITGSNGTLLGTSLVSASNGIATFSNLAIHTPDDYSLTAASTGLGTATTDAFTLSPGAATQLVITQQPASGSAGALSTITVAVEDQYGNVVTSDASTVTLAIASGPGTLGGSASVTAVNGVATFSSNSITKSGTYTVAVSDSGLTGATSSSFTIAPTAATHLAITQQPAGTSAGSVGTVTVAVEDQYNNIVTSDSSTITVAVASGSGTLLGTTAVAASNGVATFSSLALHTADTYTLDASDGGLTGATSNSFTVTSAAATHLVVMQQPTTTVAGQSISSVVVQVEDQFGNVVTSDSSTVTIGVTGGAVTLSGTKSVTVINGVATFSTLSVTTAGSYTLAVTDGSLTGATSSSFAITPAAASKLVITQQPASGSAGSLNTVTVAVEDQYGNVVTGDASTVTLAVASGSGDLLGTTSVHAVNGVATFSALALHKADSYTLTASDSALTSATSGSFTISPAAASQLVITQQPSDGQVGNLGTIKVAVEDQYGNVVTDDASSVALAINSGSGTLLGTTTVTASAGIATFSDLAIHQADSFTLHATDAGLTAANSNEFTLTAGSATQLVITQQPASTTAGTLGDITVAVEDQYGNVVTTDTSAVALAIASGSGTVSGTTTVNAVGGVATFTGLSITKADNYTLTFSGTGLTSATSDSFTMSPDVATQLVITQDATNAIAGGTLTAITVAVEDQYGNIVTSDGSDVSLDFATGSATLTGTTTVTANQGVATFNDLVLTTAGSYSFTLSDTGLTSATTARFTVFAGAPAKLEFTQQPTTRASRTLGTLTVEVHDQYDNLCDTSTTVTLNVNTTTASLTGARSVAAVHGLATLNNLTLSRNGTFALTAAANGLSGDTTNSFTVGAKLVFQTQPVTTTAGVTIPTINVQVLDSAGHVLTTDDSDVTLSIFSGPGTLNGTVTVHTVNGVATFNDLSITTAGTNYKLLASDGQMTSATSNTFTIRPDVPSQMVLLQDVSNTVAGAKIATPVRVELLDQYGNIATNNKGTVTMSVLTGPNGGALSGTVAAVVSNGVATFSNLILKTAGSYTLQASLGSLSISTSSLTVAVGAPKKLMFNQQPTSTAPNTEISPAITVDVTDAFGNIIATSSNMVTLTLASAPSGATLNTHIAAIQGEATFSHISFTKVGNYRLKATAAGLTAATSSLFTISSGRKR